MNNGPSPTFLPVCKHTASLRCAYDDVCVELRSMEMTCRIDRKETASRRCEFECEYCMKTQ